MNLIEFLTLAPVALALAVGCSPQAHENTGEAVEEPFEEVDEPTIGDESADEDDFEPDTTN